MSDNIEAKLYKYEIVFESETEHTFIVFHGRQVFGIGKSFFISSNKKMSQSEILDQFTGSIGLSSIIGELDEV